MPIYIISHAYTLIVVGCKLYHILQIYSHVEILVRILCSYISGVDLEILRRDFLTTVSGFLISQLSLMVTVGFYHPLI